MIRLFRHFVLPGIMLVAWLGAQAFFQSNLSGPMNTAMFLEKQNRLVEAAAIYEDLLRSNPRHNQAYTHLRDIYLRLDRIAEAQQLIEDHLVLVPNDVLSRISLGEIHYMKDDADTARQIWKKMREADPGNQVMLRQLFNLYVRLSLEDDLLEMITDIRQRTKSPGFMALEMGNYYQSRRVFDRALDEYLIYLKSQPRQLKYITSRILLMSDEPEAQELLENGLKIRESTRDPFIGELLGAYYFKTGQFENAFAQQLALPLQSPADAQRWLEFAEALRREKQFDLATRGYQLILSGTGIKPSAEITGQALLGLAQTFEDQIIPLESLPSLVGYFPDNIFFETHFYPAPHAIFQHAESAFRLYDSVMVELPTSSFSAQASYRLGEIQYRITRNFDGARRNYETALRSRPDQALEKLIRLRIGDITLAQGHLSEAQEYFYQSRNRGTEFQARYIQSLLLDGLIDSAAAQMNLTLKDLRPNDPWFNDFLEMTDFLNEFYVRQNEPGRGAFRTYLLAEQKIRQYKLTEAAEALAFLRELFPTAPIVPNVLLREILVRRTLGQLDSVMALIPTLHETNLGDRALILAGEITEVDFKDKAGALKFYYQFLAEYPESLLLDRVRQHIRNLTGPEGKA